MQKNIIWAAGFWLTIMIIGGCATSSYIPSPKIEGAPGIYHQVNRNDTLWKITKIYGIELEELVKINHIYDPRKIETGQLVFIPRARNIIKRPTDKSFPISGEDFIWPLKGKVISRFGQNSNNIINDGLDIQAPYGEEVLASRSGVVTFYDEQLKGLGETIIIDHGDNFLTVYGRNSEVFVKVGERVTQGKMIAKVGNAGRDKASYLHFEIRKGYLPQNPYYYLP